MMSIAEEKKNIRKLINKEKQLLDVTFKQEASEKIFNKLLQLKEWNNAKKVMAYYSLPDELQTSDYIDIMSDKEIYLPKIISDNIYITKYEKGKIQTGKFNVIEPSTNDFISSEKLDIIIIPGIAFDFNKNRLGRGKGYYDRFLSSTSAVKIGICYDFQLLKSIPTDPHDIKMDIIITPNNIIF